MKHNQEADCWQGRQKEGTSGEIRPHKTDDIKTNAKAKWT